MTPPPSFSCEPQFATGNSSAPRPRHLHGPSYLLAPFPEGGAVLALPRPPPTPPQRKRGGHPPGTPRRCRTAPGRQDTDDDGPTTRADKAAGKEGRGAGDGRRPSWDPRSSMIAVDKSPEGLPAGSTTSSRRRPTAARDWPSLDAWGSCGRARPWDLTTRLQLLEGRKEGRAGGRPAVLASR